MFSHNLKTVGSNSTSIVPLTPIIWSKYLQQFHALVDVTKNQWIDEWFTSKKHSSTYWFIKYSSSSNLVNSSFYRLTKTFRLSIPINSELTKRENLSRQKTLLYVEENRGTIGSMFFRMVIICE